MQDGARSHPTHSLIFMGFGIKRTETATTKTQPLSDLNGQSGKNKVLSKQIELVRNSEEGWKLGIEETEVQSSLSCEPFDMGSFKGHALPGTFFYITGIWWTLKTVLKYACKRHKRTSYLGSKALFHRVDIVEGIVLICMALIGMLGEQFITGGPYLSLYDYKKGQWVQLLGWHHTTMYFFFGLLGVAHILCSTISSIPASLSKLMLSNALLVEAFIFYNHTHGRDILDIFVHQLLVLVIIVAGLLAFLEFLIHHNVILELLRISFILLQGSWFWQIGFVLYPPSGGPAWDLMDHENIMFLTICLCWHYAFSFIIIGIIYAFVIWLVKSRLNNFCHSEVGLLKNVEREQESEEEM